MRQKRNADVLHEDKNAIPLSYDAIYRSVTQLSDSFLWWTGAVRLPALTPDTVSMLS